MGRLTTKMVCALAVFTMISLFSCAPADTNVSSYGEDRAQIENLQARYMFALDFGDLDTFVSTFTEDGILDIIGMKWQGREEIKKGLGNMMPPVGGGKPEAKASDVKEEKPLYRATGRHNISNIVVKIDGDTAVGRAYWFHMGNGNPERKAALDSYGYYEDELVKVNGQWLFKKRSIYNEQMAEWIGSDKNPCW
jgi:uncharacterized protein (TIGR02246 family)